MSETIFSILNVQETWESITLQLNSLFNPEKFQFLDTLGLFWDKVLNNPLASIIILLVLIGLPYTLIKAKKSSTESDVRLDRLMEEMEDFELEKPIIDLQGKFKDTTFDNSSPANDDHEVPELGIKEDSIFHDLESASFSKQLTLDEKVTDDYLATRSMPLQPEANDENSELSSLGDEILDESEISRPESSVTDEEFIDQYFENLRISDQKRDLVPVEEENLDEPEISQPESCVEEEYASHDMDDLQTRMEQAIKKLRMNYPSPGKTEEITDEETNTDSTPSVLTVVKKSSLHEETKEDDTEENASRPSSESIPSNSRTERRENFLNKSHLITHLKSFQKNLKTQFDPKTHESKK